MQKIPLQRVLGIVQLKIIANTNVLVAPLYATPGVEIVSGSQWVSISHEMWNYVFHVYIPVPVTKVLATMYQHTLG
jgi:hypothetical protein